MPPKKKKRKRKASPEKQLTESKVQFSVEDISTSFIKKREYPYGLKTS